MKNPFVKAVTAKRNTKMLVYGPSGVGKTWFGLAGKSVLQGQKVAYLGNELGATHYVDVEELSGFDVLETRDLKQVEDAVKYLAKGDHDYGLLIVDTVTDLYSLRQRRHEKPNRKTGEYEKTRSAWGRIKAEHGELMRQIINLPLHVVCIAHEKARYDRRGSEIIECGVTVDADKLDHRVFEVILHFGTKEGTRFAYVEKDRTRKTQVMSYVQNPTFSMWENRPAGSETVRIEEELTFERLIEKITRAESGAALDTLLRRHEGYIKTLTVEDRKEIDGAVSGKKSEFISEYQRHHEDIVNALNGAESLADLKRIYEQHKGEIATLPDQLKKSVTQEKDRLKTALAKSEAA